MSFSGGQSKISSVDVPIDFTESEMTDINFDDAFSIQETMDEINSRDVENLKTLHEIQQDLIASNDSRMRYWADRLDGYVREMKN